MVIWKKLELPSEKLDTFSPSLNIRVFDNTKLGHKSLIGVHEIKSLREFEVQCNSEEGKQEDRTGDIRQATGAKGKSPAGTTRKDQESEDHELFDWWSKYYASKELAATKASEEEASSSHESEQLTEHTKKYIERGYDTLTILASALEDMPQFRGRNDFVSTFPLRKGKTKSAKDEDDTIVGQFKGTFRILNDPNSNHQSLSTLHLPSRKPVDCVVRVYVVRGIQLQPKDRDGLADPYLIVSLGKKSQGKRSEHKVKTLNPEFGRVFEFRVKIPLVKNLKIQVKDYDFPPDPDDLIGETEIDLEQRLLSRYHATCGLPKTYFKSGPFQWRDTLTPFQLLAKHCIRTGQKMRLDKGTPEKIHIGDDSYPLEDSGTEESSNPEIEERLQCLALQILNSFKLVPEHVETRPLFSKVRPDIEQGKLEMWVDIFSEEDEEFLSHVENLITGGKIKLFNDNDSDNDNDGQSDSDN
ncbi:myoferlin-like [Porites lutea]|uniref:myoferlin-like n=1 Tax=Porites lutea TaxID=51062 RepID=UPI003CC51480